MYYLVRPYVVHLCIYYNVLTRVSHGADGDTPEGGHGSHGPWNSAMLAKYGEQIVPQFGLYNAQTSYPIAEFTRWIRINKEAHQARGLRGMVPWVTTGFDGVLEPAQVLAQAVHMLAGGCTGFNLFSSAADGDWDSWGNMLAFSKSVELVGPYEDIVVLGKVAHDAVSHKSSRSNVRAVSAMEFQGQFVIALSASDGEQPMQVSISIPSTMEYEWVNVLSGTSIPLSKGATLATLSVQQRAGEEFALVVVKPQGDL